VLTDVDISGNTATSGDGGGLFNLGSSPVLTDVTISDNNASNGGGIYNSGSSPVLTGVQITKNRASRGGGIYNITNSSPALTNVMIAGNLATIHGGGIFNDDSSPVLTNVTIAGNKANSGNGGGINNDSLSAPKIRNSIIWGNRDGTNTAGIVGGVSVISYSIVEDNADTSNGNKILPSGLPNTPFEGWQDPASVTTPNSAGNYRLKSASPASPAIDMGNDSLYPNSAGDIAALMGEPLNYFPATASVAINRALAIDLGGKVRGRDTIDMGAYENQGSISNPNDLALITVIFGDRGSGAFSQNSFTISKSRAETKTITITGSGHSNPRWYVDGIRIVGLNGETSITLKAEDYSVGGHSMGLWLTKDVKLWSKELAFTVGN
jgi:hypothetical protein